MTPTMANVKQSAEANRRATRIHRNVGDEIRRLREDAALSRRLLASAADVDLAFLCRIEDGKERPSITTYSKLATALGADLSVRLFPTTGPGIRDRHQARILEALIDYVGPRWRVIPEVAVRSPARGWIDAVLHSEADGQLVATEIESDLRRIEQQLRWFPEKVASLPSWEGFGHFSLSAPVSRLLVVRSSRTTRDLGRAFERQLAAAYPAHPADAIAALAGDTPWPGPALIWAAIEPDRVRFIGKR